MLLKYFLSILFQDRIMMIDKNENREAVVINDVVHPDGSVAGTEVLIKTPITYD